jgi:glycosyltransferase involved in cell wall biosynthesis
MKILLINKFLFPKGGDVISTLNTGKLLSDKGHNVVFWGMKHPLNPEYPYSEYFIDYVDYLKPMGIKERINITVNILYSLEAKNKIEKLLNKLKPDIVHLSNIYHQISPSILSVFKKYKIPVVMTMHDYKLVCPAYVMLAGGKPCEMCRDGRYYWCFLKKCVKDSYAKSLVNTFEMYLHHKICNIYDFIDAFISPSRFLKEKVKEIGFKREIIHLPNFINVGEYIPEYGFYENAICYVGRLSGEKGLFTLIRAVKGIDITLKIIGTGPIEEDLKKRATREKIDNVKFLGYMTGEDLKNGIRSSMAVVLPSEWYESNPRSVLEAFALGKSVIGARIGGIPELVIDGETGLTFEPGNAEDLKNRIDYLIKKPDLVIEMGKNARKFVEENFNPEKHYQELMKIYQMATGR